MSAKAVDDRSFNDQVLNSEVPVLVDFWAPWCGPCRAMSNVVDQVADDVEGRASVVKVNVDEAQATAIKYGIESIPSFAVIQGGEIKDKAVGVVPGKRLLDMLHPYLN